MAAVSWQVKQQKWWQSPSRLCIQSLDTPSLSTENHAQKEPGRCWRGAVRRWSPSALPACPSRVSSWKPPHLLPLVRLLLPPLQRVQGGSPASRLGPAGTHAHPCRQWENCTVFQHANSLGSRRRSTALLREDFLGFAGRLRNV